MENEQNEKNLSHGGLLVDRMAALEMLPEDAFKGDTTGAFWEFMEQPDPEKFSPELKAILKRHKLM